MMNGRVIVVLIILYFIYMVVGAAIFMACERPHEIARCDAAMVAKKRWMKIIHEKRGLDEELLYEFILNVTYFARSGISLQGDVKCPVNWDFQSSVFFAGTIITTIGYGNLAPVQWYSQIFCIIYAIIGIPLFAIMFAGIGQYITEIVKRILRKFEVPNSPQERRILYSIYSFVIIVGGSIVFFMLIPAIIFKYVEDWTYQESFYFCFISLSTIGLGDFVVGANPTKKYIALYRIMVLFWILFGLAYTFTAINLIVDIFRRTFTKSATIQSCLRAWSEAEEDVLSEVESLFGAGSSNGSADFEAGITGLHPNDEDTADNDVTGLESNASGSESNRVDETGMTESTDDRGLIDTIDDDDLTEVDSAT